MMCMDFSLYCKSQDIDHVELLEDIQPHLISKSSDSVSRSQENEISLKSNDCLSSTLLIGVEDNNNFKSKDSNSENSDICNVSNSKHSGMNKQRSSSLQDLPGSTSFWNQSKQSRAVPCLVSSESKDSGLPLSSSCVSLCSGEKNSNNSVKDRIAHTSRRWSLQSNCVHKPSIDILYRELEEKDAMLEKLQEKYNELLVLYAESRNMIDRLRCHSCDESIAGNQLKPYETSRHIKRFEFYNHSTALSDFTSNKTHNSVSSVNIAQRPVSICRRSSPDSLHSVSSSTESSVSKVQRWQQQSWSSNSTDDHSIVSIPQIEENLSNCDSDRTSIVSTPPLQRISESLVPECEDTPDLPLSKTVQGQSRSREEKTETNDNDTIYSSEEKTILLFLNKVEACAKQLHAQSEAIKRVTLSVCRKQ